MAIFPGNSPRPYVRGPRRVVEEPYRVNERILAPKVRVVGENIKVDVYPTSVAIKMAQEQGLDLVEISPNADPPVVRIVDYNKFLYQKKKREKELKANQVKVDLKEIRFGPETGEHDFEFKLRHAKTFLSEGNKVKAYVQFRGRAIVFKERGELLLLRFMKELEEYGAAEQLPKLEGKRMMVIMTPKKAAGAKKKAD